MKSPTADNKEELFTNTEHIYHVLEGPDPNSGDSKPVRQHPISAVMISHWAGFVSATKTVCNCAQEKQAHRATCKCC